MAKLHRFEARDRRLEPVFVRELGPTPLIETSLGLRQLPGHLAGPWDVPRCAIRCSWVVGSIGPAFGLVDSEADSRFIIPRENELGPEDCYVPAGFFVSGGDPEAADGLARQRLWVDGFVIGAFPVRQREYLAFLNALLPAGREEDVNRYRPRVRVNRGGAAQRPLYAIDEKSGLLVLGLGGDDKPLDPEWPVTQVDDVSARAFAAWKSGTGTGDWRLPMAAEWEKAVRGVDGRFWPWGDHFEASWACTVLSHKGAPNICTVDAFAGDVGPYGLRGACGNVRNLCGSVWTKDGSADGGLQVDSVLRAAASDAAVEYWEVRGGSWTSAPHLCRPATRLVMQPGARMSAVGFRLARNLGRNGAESGEMDPAGDIQQTG